MPVTITAKRALRSSKRKYNQNETDRRALEIAIRMAKTSKKSDAVKKAMTLLDRSAKKNQIHKNKAARLKSALSKLAKTSPAQAPKKTTKKK